ncbi:MAG TPA: phosphoribosylamine--glycine ligase [Bdellovibrionales bacterium]|mgnify:CR=1 FL=1|nr:phosphoribosylamine--glycine ligase [Bdellovibrionales bacterium]
MRFLVLGQGGREHAIVRALKFSPSVTEIHASPGSDGISQEAICHKIDLNDEKALAEFVKRYQFDCVVVGPEAYLVAGVSDRLRALGVPTVGPSQAAAQLEGSKIFAKEFMVQAGIPTAAFEVVDNVADTLRAAQKFTPPYVLKADGLAAGKGVFLCPTLPELKAAAEALFEKKALGQACARALLEQFQPGYEISYLILTNGEGHEVLPLSQDHKRLRDGDEGPNTGGMGVVGPLHIDEALRRQIEEKIVQPSVRHLGGSGLLYRGVLYIGLMITPSGPTVIEYNARFGDPEAQVILPLLDGDWGYVFAKLARGEMTEMKWKNLQMACVVMAAAGYPENPEKGVAIEGDLGAQTPSSYFLHAGTAKTGGQWVCDGGRVLNAVGMGTSRADALKAAYGQARQATWRGMRMRSDIGAKI